MMVNSRRGQRLVECIILVCLMYSFGSGITPLQAGEALAFSDEFIGSSLDTDDWIIEKRPGKGQGTKDPELQFYTPEAVTVSDGDLHLTIQKGEPEENHLHPPLHLLSGRVQSQHAFLYGRFEFRVKLPAGNGLWPKIWLRTKLPANGELDLLEGYGSHPNLIQSSLHPWVNGVEDRYFSTYLVVKPQPDSPKFHRPDVERLDHLVSLTRDLSQDFHVYVLDWQPDHVTWFFDGVPYFTMTDHVPKEPMVVILQLAACESWDGVPDASTKLPKSMDVDFVRIWQKHH